MADEERVRLVLLAQNIEMLTAGILDESIYLPWIRLTESEGGNLDVNGSGRQVWTLCSLFGCLKLQHIDGGYGYEPHIMLSVAETDVQLHDVHRAQLLAYAWTRICSRQVVQVD